MPMNEEVRKAVKAVRKHFDLSMDDDASEAWCKVRAELTRLTAIADSVDPLVVRPGEVTTKLEAANALLRECFSGDSDAEQYFGVGLFNRIQAHLSEPRT